MSSTRTHHSGNSSSATPPVIPPLDLRPQFPGPLPPDSIFTRDIADEGLGSHDDESTRRESFVTAQSAGAPRESRYSAMLLDLDHEPLDEESEDLLFDQPAGSSQDPHEYEHDTPRPPPAARTHSPIRPESRSSTYSPSYPFRHPHRDVDHDAGVYAPSLRTLESVRSSSSSFIDRHFAGSEPYLSSRTECSSARHASEKWAKQTEKSDTARTLFWLGFIAPWCWLIGGWLVKAKKSDRSGGMLPLWTGKSTRHDDSFKMQPLQHGYPFVAPSVQSLMPPLYSRAAHPRGPFLMARSPWIRRCRIAACVSGIIIMLLFIAALVVVGRSNRFDS
ncbi:hypothetical protein K503DRAFT_770863 [Rhizopogon vinicolor AM-OR11-026]|uniref:Uncharacterized protein n=1 Tax=Rhizopogon vinicolor AM-OR11-026 TaxID=1314800 RepID=A0A1B7MZM6_9AGAM|nr:hypothetical protein K503DRAFT_770863 [Rhizopogon vinicolor AM-OR11-026]